MPTLASCLTFKIYVHYRYAFYFSKVVLCITELLQSSNDLQWENICLHARNYIFTILSNLASVIFSYNIKIAFPKSGELTH